MEGLLAEERLSLSSIVKCRRGVKERVRVRSINSCPSIDNRKWIYDCIEKLEEQLVIIDSDGARYLVFEVGREGSIKEYLETP